jgi:hypothetical protein
MLLIGWLVDWLVAWFCLCFVACGFFVYVVYDFASFYEGVVIKVLTSVDSLIFEKE